MKKLTANQRRNRYWLINVFLFHFLKLNPFRKKDLWIFGAWEGQKYDDNTRYLFEYIHENHKEITPVWFTKREDIYKNLKEKGFRTEMIGTKSAVKTQLKAGAVFYTNGMDDLGNICMFSGAKIFAIWHGMIIKKAYYARMKHSGIHYFLKRIKDTIYSAIYMDYFVGTSEYAIHNLCAVFRQKEKKALLTGLPRNDVFKHPPKKQDVICGLPLSDHQKIILYMPTHREYDNEPIEHTVKILDQNKELNRFLKDNNAIILFKPHYLTKIDYQMTSACIKCVTGEQVRSTQELLAVSDVLITDYSSCIMDFSTMNKPSLLFASDLDRYVDHLGFMKPWDTLYKEIATTDEKQFISDIMKSIKEPENTLSITNIFNQYYQDERLKTARSYAENVYEAAYNIVCKRRLKKEK